MDDRKIAEVSLAYVSNNHNKNITGMRDPRRQFIWTNNAWLHKIKSLLFARPDIFGKRLMWRDKLIVSCSCCNILLFGGKASTPDTLHVECSDVCKKKGFYSIMVSFKSDNLNLNCVVWIASHAFVEQKYTWILN